jgi:hypothetical protein
MVLQSAMTITGIYKKIQASMIATKGHGDKSIHEAHPQ